MMEENGKKLQELIEDVKTCMFTTTDDEYNVFNRPMITIKIDNEYNLWFFSNEDSKKIENVTADKHVTLVYSHPGKNTYLNIHGICTIMHDKETMYQLWVPALKSWFPDGIDDPQLCLLKVSVQEALYWDNSTSEMMPLFCNDVHNSYQNANEESVVVPKESTW
jgi:general stress protein 26